MQIYLGAILAVGFTFVPPGFQACDGSLLSISEFEALFTLLGTTYGGDGQSTFAVPDLRGRVPIHYGSGTGLSSYVIGQTGGSESVTLISNQMPAHTHNLLASNGAGSISPSGQYFGTSGKNLYAVGSGASVMGDIVGATGGSQAHENRQPFLVVNYIIATEGIYPSRS